MDIATYSKKGVFRCIGAVERSGASIRTAWSWLVDLKLAKGLMGVTKTLKTSQDSGGGREGGDPFGPWAKRQTGSIPL